MRSLKAQQIWLAGSSFIGRCPVSGVECTFLVENLGWKILVGNLEWKVFGGQYLVEFFAGKFWWTIWADFFGVNTIFVFVCIVDFVFVLSLP